jgi:hypothetical protein
MSNVTVVYRKDKSCLIRVYSPHSPYEHFDSNGARRRAKEMLEAADLCDSENAALAMKQDE